MDAILEKEVRDAIEKSLPSQVSKVLGEELTALAKLRQAAAGYLEQTTLMTADIEALRTICKEYQAAIKSHGELDVKIKDIAARELAMAMTELKAKIADERRIEIKDLVVQLFRSPVRTETFNGNVPVPVTGSLGGMNSMGTTGFVMQSPVNTTHTSETK